MIVHIILIKEQVMEIYGFQNQFSLEKNQIYFLVLIMALPGLLLAGSIFHDNSLLPHSLWEFMHIGFLTTVLILSYMNTYPGIEGDSPSLVIVLNIAKAGPDGLQKEVLETTLNDDLLVRPRIRDLLLDQMAYLEDDKYYLTTKGLIMAKVFTFYRNLQGLPKGG